MTREERYRFIATQIHFADWFMHFHLNFDEELHQALKEAEEIINDLSAVPEREKGEWKDKTPEEDALPIYTCSECGMANLWESPFCPNCGADMRE